MAWFRAWWLALALYCLALPARAQDWEGARSLLSDVQRIVAAQQAEEWFSDQEALKHIGESLLASVCRASPEARAWALAGLRKSHREAGDARTLYARDHEVSDEVTHALDIERQLLALETSLARVGECPFWVPPQQGFQGLQTDRKRVTYSLESGGNVQLRYTEGHWTFGGGGLGRLLVGYGFDGRYTFLAGAEFGGGAMLRPGTNASQFVINYFPAIPLVLRTRELTWQYDVEVGPVGVFQADDTRLSYGMRFGGTFAFTTLRRRNVLPWAGLSMGYEYYFESGGRQVTHFIRSSLRIGLPWDP
jgi:hypothetical protein